MHVGACPSFYIVLETEFRLSCLGQQAFLSTELSPQLSFHSLPPQEEVSLEDAYIPLPENSMNSLTLLCLPHPVHCSWKSRKSPLIT